MNEDTEGFSESDNPKQEFAEQISETIDGSQEGDLTYRDDDKVVYNIMELMEMQDNTKYLLEPLLPKVGVTMLASVPDVGKSTLAQQLCLQIAAGNTTFLDFVLKAERKSAIYVATEDSAQKIAERLKKQAAGLGVSIQTGFTVISADAMSATEILAAIDEVATREKPSIIVVDAFGDAFKGQDINSNTQTRKMMQEYSYLAKKHQCLVLFVHHVNKEAYNRMPTQQDLQGGSGIGQKVRTALCLFKGKDNNKYMFVLKGNYTKEEFKKNAIQLDMDTDNFLFKATGVTIPLGRLQSNQQKDYQSIAEQAFDGTESFQYNQLKEKIMKVASIAETAAKSYIKIMVSESIVQKMEDGKYKLNQ